jgi:superfamily II DNA or RNA helicase
MLAQARAHLRAGTSSIVMQAPTGAGKTVMVAHMVATAAQRGHTCWFLAHRRELIQQGSGTFQECGVPHGIIAAGLDANDSCGVQVASVQTVSRRLHRLAKPTMIVWDECHHVAARSWARIREENPQAIHIGLTATPERLDGHGLDRWFEAIVVGPSVETLTADGWLSPFRIFAPALPDLSGVRTRYGDYARDDLAKAIDRPRIVGNAVEHYRRVMDGRRAVVFACTVLHSTHLAAAFREAGIVAEHVDGSTKTDERDAAVERFRSGETRILCNVELFGEGFDLPAMEGAILCRPTQSLSMYLQQCGRALRPYPGKDEAIILDHAGNCYRHGFPSDERTWSLQGREKRTRRQLEQEVKVRICPSCFGAMPQDVVVCAYCGHKFEPRQDLPSHQEGELEEVQPRAKLREAGRARDFDSLVALGESRGYRYPELWARRVLDARANYKRKARVR